MRAERLLRLILTLSDGRRRTARALAERLEISERTLFRDLDALEEAGIPVETTRGAEGGIALARGWGRVPGGLTTAEVSGLAALMVPGALADVALETPLRDAIGKILAALPAVQRAQAEAARQRLLVDPSPWWSARAPPPHLETLREAVWTDRRVRLGYRTPEAPPRVVDALALVVKGERWYLLAGTEEGQRIFRGDRVISAEILPEGFTRPELDLPAVWRAHCEEFERTRPRYPVELALTEAGAARLRALRPLEERAGIVAGGCAVDFQQEEIALSQLALLGAEARVLGPEALQARLRELASAWTHKG